MKNVPAKLADGLYSLLFFIIIPLDSKSQFQRDNMR